MQSPNESRRIAMLVDGDNAQPALLGHALDETAKHGDVITRRVYGNWTNSGKSAWKKAIHECAALPVQQFAYIPGKNATDIALIIEAMDLLHSGTVDGFCVVSSDSDYTRLAIRIREQGMFMMGVGRSDTPESFQNACEVFVHTEQFAPEKAKAGKQESAAAQAAPQSGGDGKAAPADNSWIPIIRQALESAEKDPDGWANLSRVGTHLKRIKADFNHKDYGYKQLGLLIRSRPRLFEVKGSQTSTAVKAKGKRA